VYRLFFYQKSQRFFAVLSLFFCLLFTASAFEAPALTGRVVDEAHVLKSAEKSKIDNALQEFEKKTGGQLFAAFLNAFDDATIEEAGIKLMDEWKPGQKGKDNGAILLIVPEMRQMRLEVGYGWEGEINDAKAGDIIRMMADYFKGNRYCDGVLAAIGQIEYDITGKMSDEFQAMRQETDSQSKNGEWFMLIFFLIFIIMFIRNPRMMLHSLIFGSSSGGRGSGSRGGGFSGGGGGRGGGGGASGRW